MKDVTENAKGILDKLIIKADANESYYLDEEEYERAEFWSGYGAALELMKNWIKGKEHKYIEVLRNN